MTRFRSTLVALGALAILSTPAMAQGQGRGQGPMGGMMGRMAGIQLLGAPAVHKELGLSEEQAEKFQALAAEFRETTMSRFGELRDLEPEERQAKSAEIMAEVEKKMAEGVKAALEPKQLDRFEQIRIQAMGLQAFSNPMVDEKLKLTEDQKATMEGLATDLEADTREAFMAAREAGPEGMAAAGEKIARLRKDAMAKAADALTDEQKTAWKDLVGEPFEMPPGMGLGGRGGRGGANRPQN
jgi:hypothetical protein